MPRISDLISPEKFEELHLFKRMLQGVKVLPRPKKSRKTNGA